MTFRPPFSPAEIQYVRDHLDEWPSILTYKMSALFGTVRKKRGVENLIKKLKEETCPM